MKFYVILRDKLYYDVNIVLYGFSGLRDCISWLKANYKSKLHLTQYPEFIISKDTNGHYRTYNVYAFNDEGIKLRCHYNGV